MRNIILQRVLWALIFFLEETHLACRNNFHYKATLWIPKAYTEMHWKGSLTRKNFAEKLCIRKFCIRNLSPWEQFPENNFLQAKVFPEIILSSETIIFLRCFNDTEISLPRKCLFSGKAYPLGEDISFPCARFCHIQISFLSFNILQEKQDPSR